MFLQKYDYKRADAHQNLQVRVEGNPEKILLIVSPCRSGSTALLNAFTMAGWDGVFQPLKTSIRRFMVADTSPVTINSTSDVLVIKEALGPYQPSEVYYNPLNIIQEKFEPKSLSLIALLRNPADCLRSWDKGFSQGPFPDFKPTLFSQAYQEVLDTYQAAQDSGIDCVALRLEDLSNHAMLPIVLQHLGLPYDNRIVDWTSSEFYRPHAYGFQKPDELELFRVKGLLDGTKHGTRFSVPPSSTFNILANPKYAKIAEQAGFNEATRIYNEFGELPPKLNAY